MLGEVCLIFIRVSAKTLITSSFLICDSVSSILVNLDGMLPFKSFSLLIFNVEFQTFVKTYREHLNLVKLNI